MIAVSVYGTGYGFSGLPGGGAGDPAATADDVTDTIQSALDAYNEGDIAYATEELNFALQLLKEMRAGDLMSFLPEALDGWTREIDGDAAMALGMMGGTGASALSTSLTLRS